MLVKSECESIMRQYSSPWYMSKICCLAKRTIAYFDGMVTLLMFVSKIPILNFLEYNLPFHLSIQTTSNFVQTHTQILVQDYLLSRTDCITFQNIRNLYNLERLHKSYPVLLANHLSDHEQSSQNRYTRIRRRNTIHMIRTNTKQNNKIILHFIYYYARYFNYSDIYPFGQEVNLKK